MKKINYDSEVNQRIKGKLVEREVIYCQSGLIEKLLQSEDFINEGYNYEDIENLGRVVCRECGSNNYEDDKCLDCGEEFCDEVEDQEIFEWWLVTDYFGRKLSEYGEPILKADYGTYWGRTGTGQAILLDSVINKIAEEMEILEEQSNSWA